MKQPKSMPIPKDIAVILFVTTPDRSMQLKQIPIEQFQMHEANKNEHHYYEG